MTRATVYENSIKRVVNISSLVAVAEADLGTVTFVFATHKLLLKFSSITLSKQKWQLIHLGEFTVWAGQNKVVLNAGDRFLILVDTPQAAGVLNDCPARGLVVAAPSGFARLIAATVMLSETQTTDMELFVQIAEMGDELLSDAI